MSIPTASLNQQIACCAGALQTRRGQRRQLQTRLLLRLQTPLLLSGMVLLGAGICYQWAADPVVRKPKQQYRPWLQRLELWVFALWQLLQRAPDR